MGIPLGFFIVVDGDMPVYWDGIKGYSLSIYDRDYLSTTHPICQ